MKNVNDVLVFDYSGQVQEFNTPYKGVYKLEVWGAEGGNRGGTAYGGKGGYSCGQITLEKGEILYIYVGGNGNDGKGYNGGGQVGSTAVYGGGGTDIRKDGTELANRIIVAGGGGSVGAADKPGGYGGGTSGESRTDSFGSGGGGATQSAGGAGASGYENTNGSLGQGGRGRAVNSGKGGAGGGGYYGGGGVYPDSSGDDDRGGGGGSGYVSNTLLTNRKLFAGNKSMPIKGETSPSNSIGNSGHGYCRITLLEKFTSPVYVNINGSYKEAVSYVNINGTYKEAEPFINVNGQWFKI